MTDLEEIPDLDQDEGGLLDEVDVFVLLEDLDDEVPVEDSLVV